MTHNTKGGIEIVKEVDLLLQEGKYIEAMDLFLTAYKEQQEYLPDSEYRHALGDEVISQALYRAYKELREYTLWQHHI